MKPGSIVMLGDKLGIARHFDDIKRGVTIHLEDGTLKATYTDLPEVTEFTPELVTRLVKYLPQAVFSVTDKSFGMTGTDPEIFGFDPKGHVIPAWLWLQDKKANPEYYYDGVQAELVTAPVTCHNYQTDFVRNKLVFVNQALKAYNPNAYLATTDTVKLDRKTLLTADDKYIELGCSPSYNAYPEVKPLDIGDPRQHPYRYSGCHLHMSVLDYPIPEWFPHGTVVMMDKILGVMLTALGRGLEDPIRRKAYGRAGEFRVPPPTIQDTNAYGSPFTGKPWTRLEYRTPGSFLLHHPALFNFAVDIGRVAFRMGLMYDGRKLDEIGDVQGIINNCDADAAVKLLTAPGSYLKAVLASRKLSAAYNTPATLDILTSGAKASGRFKGSVYDNWKLGGSWELNNYGNGRTKWESVAI